MNCESTFVFVISYVTLRGSGSCCIPYQVIGKTSICGCSTEAILSFTVFDHPNRDYRYYEGGVSSVYFWDLDDGFAGVILLKKSAFLTLAKYPLRRPRLIQPKI